VRRLLGGLLWLAPREFRGRYGGELLAFHEERLRAGPLSLWAQMRVVGDLVVTIAIEWGRVLGTISSPEDDQRTLSPGERVSVFLQEIQHAARSLRKSVGFSVAAVFTLALGLASTTAIFSIVDSVLLKPLPFPDSDRVVVPQSHNGATNDSWSVTYADFMDWRDHGVFAAVATFQESDFDLTSAGEPLRVKTVVVAPQFFSVLGVKPALGRPLEPYDFPVSAPRAVVISDRLWKGHFGGRADIVGTEVEMNGAKRPIVGVMPPQVRWPLEGDVWVPYRVDNEQHEDLRRRDNYVFQAIARLKPGATLESTGAAMRLLAARAAQDHPLIRKDVTTVPTPIMNSLLGDSTPRALWILLGAVGLLLAIACVNVANLQLARASARQREMAVRTALGASRYRLVRQTLVESAVLGAAGGALGVILANWMVKALVAAAPADVPRIESARLNVTVLLFATGISILVALLFGLVPAAHASRSNPNLAMSGGGRSSGTRASSRTRRVLVISELALSVVLLVGAGLALRSIQQLQSVRPGFDAPSILTASISLPGGRYRTNADVVRFMYTLRDRLAAAPGIEGAGITSASPLGAGGFYLGRSMAMQGKAPVPENEISVNWNLATPGYFGALGVPIRGRDFTSRDDSAATPVMIVNESFAKAMFGTANPLGQRAMSTRDEKVYREIVGVVPDVKFFGLRDSTRALVWVPYAQNAWGFGIVTVRTSNANALAVVGTMRRELATLDRNIALAEVGTMDQAAARSIASERMIAVLLTAFAALALALAAIGIFGVLSYAVAQRTRELGVRMALGAQRRDVLTLILREMTPLVGIGVAIGIGAGLALTQLMRAMLFEVRPTDPLTFAAVPVLLCVVGIAAALVPARRAARVSPLTALRSE
jgi:putative ABC transport system permease protein